MFSFNFVKDSALESEATTCGRNIMRAPVDVDLLKVARFFVPIELFE